MLYWFLSGPFIYLSLFIFIVFSAIKLRSYITMPRHLRWDLYPVPHQGADGSKYQKVDFHKAPAKFSLFYECKEMMGEMILIKKAFVHNLKLWLGSFPLHIGLYISGLWLAFLVVGALLELYGLKVTAQTDNLLPSLVYYATLFTGPIGFSLGFLGSFILLGLRYSDNHLRSMSDFVTYVNLYLMISLFGSATLAWWFVDPTFELIRHHAISLITLNPSIVPHPLLAVQLFTFCLFIIYLPFSRMFHVSAKYFFYHKIMWDDEAMKANSKLENSVSNYLNYPVDWSASHVAKGKSWLEQVKNGKDGGQDKHG
ncbi:hypothetical protein [Dendrosporobacter sp. 1207_IL3150]|uniref:hypothetical protein n=1 Tax=Dendrosporobacter sp. 1207_IL3150 TaxID=3084054 RepID=UPI002FD9B386